MSGVNKPRNPKPKLCDVLEEIDTLKKAHEDLIQKKSSEVLATKIQALERENARLRKELSTETKELREKVQSDDELTRKQARLGQLWELEECKALLVKQFDINDKNKTQIKKLKQEVNDLKEKKAGKGGKRPKPEDHEAFEDLKSKYKESQEENEELKAEFQALVYEVEDFEKEIADLKNKLEVSAQQETTIMELRQQLKQHEEEKKALRELNKLKEKETEDAKQELEELKANFKKTPLVSNSKDTVRNLKCRQEDVLEEIDTLKKAHEDLIQKKSSEVLATKIQALERENARLRKELSTETKELREKGQTDDELTRKQAKLGQLWELEECKALLVKQFDIIDKNKTQIKKLKQEVNDLKEKKAGKGGKRPKPEDHEAFEDLKSKYKESQEENEDLKAEFQALVYEVEDFEKEIADLKKKLEVSAQQETTIIELRQQLKQHEVEKQELEELKANIKKTPQVSKLKDTVRNLKCRQKEMMEEITNLENILEEMETTKNSGDKEMKTVSVQTDSDVKEMETVSVQTDSDVTEMKTVSVQTDSDVKEMETVSVQTDSDVKEMETVSVQTDSDVTEMETVSVQTDSDVKEMETVSVQTDSVSQEGITKKEEEVVVGVKQKKGKKVKKFSFTIFLLGHPH